MVWFQIDDGMWSHPKILQLSPDAGWLWTRAGAYCAQHLTDGLIPDVALRILGATEDAIAELLDAELWHDTDDGYVFHDWHAYQRTRERVESEREASRQRQAKARAAKAQSNAVSHGVSHGVTYGVSHGVSHTARAEPSRAEPLEELLITADAEIGTKKDDFATFWDAYPRKVGKRKAQQAFKAALTRASAYLIIGGALQYRDDPNREPSFTAHPTTWLNRDGWNDDPLPPREQPPPGDPPQRPTPIPPTFDAAALRPADPIPMPDNIRQFKGASA